MIRACCVLNGPITVDTSKWCLRIGLWRRHYQHVGQASMWTVLDGDMSLRSRPLFRRYTGGVPVKKNREIVEDTREKQRHKHQHTNTNTNTNTNTHQGWLLSASRSCFRDTEQEHQHNTEKKNGSNNRSHTTTISTACTTTTINMLGWICK